MAELVGGAIVSCIVNTLFDRLTSQEVLSLFQGKKGTSKQLDELRSRLQSTNRLLNDSEVKQLTDEDVKKLLDDLKEVVYEADPAMDKINTEALRRKGEDDEQSGRKASGKAKKELMSPDEIKARITRRKAAARKGKSILSTTKPITLDDESQAIPSSAHLSTPHSHKRKRGESCKLELNVPGRLSPQQDFSAAAQIGGALKTQVDFDFLSNRSFPSLLEEYVSRAGQLGLAMSAKYTAMDLGHTTLIKERDGLLAKLEDERKIAKDLEDKLRTRLDKAEKLLTEKDERIFELIEEGKDQYTDGWSRARLDTLLQHRDGKLAEKETATEIQQLTEYFSDAENEDFSSRPHDVVQVVTCLVDDEKTPSESEEQVAENIEE